MKTRFAPSPTGLMHFGNLRTALFNYLYAKKEHGSLVLRIEDTDLERSTTEFYDSLLTDLLWLGLRWQEGPYKQSDRTAIYDQYFQQLEAQNLAYPCFCSEEELAITRKVQIASSLPPRYSGTCTKLTKTEIQAKIAAGLKPTLRFKVPQNETIAFIDLIKGQQSFNSNDLGDFIIRRQDGSASFMLCNAIDDADMGITHALRGDDHLTNTPRQIMILTALKLSIPTYGHFPMINGLDGTPLSKRNGSESIQSLREQGFRPLAVLNYLARLGHYYEQNQLLSLEELSEHFNISHINNSPARHDNTHLKHWQKECLLTLSATDFWQLIKSEVEHLVPVANSLAFAELVLPNVLMPHEATAWATAIFAKNLPALEDSEQIILQQAGLEFFTLAETFLKENPAANLNQLLTALKLQTGTKGKALFMPIRIALTGKQHGPELAKILTLIGNEKAKARFTKAKQYCHK